MTRITEQHKSLRGVLHVDKPSGMTSRDVVDHIARPFRGLKVGHAGTLDPLASGVLVLCVGAATRLIEYVQAMPKIYRATVRLGARSTTDDADGEVVPTVDALAAGRDEIETALARQVGTFLQAPPAYSALKVAGRRAYDLARAGASVELAPRPVTVHRIEIVDFAWPRLVLDVHCEGGTYIRSIARDLGDNLGCGGLIETLARTAIGAFHIEEAVPLDAVTPETLPGLLRPMAVAVEALPRVRIDEPQRRAILQGKSISCPSSGTPTGEVALIDHEGELVAVGHSEPSLGRVSPRKVLAQS